MNYQHSLAKILLDIHAITINITEPYQYSSGIKSPMYCDNRLIISYPAYRKMVRDAFVAIIAQRALVFDVIAGTETAGIPHAAWLAEAVDKPMIYIRKQSKGYGKNKLYEGKLEKGQTVIIVDDLVTTGASALAAVQKMRDEGARVTNCLAIFTYGLARATQNFQEANVALHAIINLPELLTVAVEENYITVAEKKMIALWADDPEHWSP